MDILKKIIIDSLGSFIQDTYFEETPQGTTIQVDVVNGVAGKPYEIIEGQCKHVEDQPLQIEDKTNGV